MVERFYNMSYVGSYFKVVDNTGVRMTKCICSYGKGKIKLGSFVLLILKKVRPNTKKLKQGMKLKGYVISIKQEIIRRGGQRIIIKSNDVVLLKKNGDLLGTRLKATVLSELRLLKKFNKILSLATYIV